MEDDEQEQRRRKVEAGRAKLAHFRQRKTKGDCTHSKKTPAKRKGTTVHAPVAEESPVAAPWDGGPLGGLDIGKNPTGSDAPDGADAAQLQEPSRERTPPKLDGHCAEQPGVMTKELELEVLRLSLSDMHAARLERTQAHLQREKEAALAELHAELTGRHAQERALLQSRARRELELVREEAAELKEKLQSEMEKNAQMIEILKQDWESERDTCLENLRQELLEKHRSELENLQNQFKKELAQQKAELEKVFQAKHQAECSLQTQEAQHEASLSKLRADLQLEHCQYLEELELRFRKKEKESQLELERLRASYEELQARSREEIQRLGSQLESARSSRQELSELREQLLARASHVEELELLKRDLEQQQQQERSRHESELEQLRLYFEEKLREAEQSYQEDLTLLQQRLQEGRDDSLLEAMGTRACLEEEERDHLDGLSLQREQLEESLGLRTRLEDNPQCQLAAGTSSRDAQQEVLEGELPSGPSEEPGQELAQEPLLCAQSTALELETEVPAGDLGLEAAHKAQLLVLPVELKEEIDLLKVENRNLQEKLQREICLKEDLEKMKQNLVEAHQKELKSAEERIEQMKQELREREAEWKVTSEDLRRGAEERLTKMLLDLREQVESEKRSMMNRFELRESEMRQLQDQQAAQILDLEGSLVEQQGRLRQLELGLTGDESVRCSQCGQELGCGVAAGAQDQELAMLHLKEDCALQLKVAQSRFLEERRAITEKLAAEQDAFLREAQEQHAHELQLLQEGHQRHILSLTTELETRRQAEVDALRSSFERERWALAEAREAESQRKHAAEVSVLEARHRSHLDALRLQYLSELQAVQGRHRRALELLRLDLEERLQREDVAHHGVLTRVLELLELRCAEEPQSTDNSLRGDGSVEPPEGVKALWMPGARKEPKAQCSAPQAEQEEELKLLESKPEASLEQQVTPLQGEFGSERKAALREKEEIHKCEHEEAHSLYEKEKESLSLQLQEKNNQILQLKDQILSLNQEIEERHSELEKLQQRRERENQEGTNLIAMLKSDVDLSHGERRALQDTLRRLLGLFGETLQTAIALKSRIGERVGLCLEDRSPPTTQLGGQSPPTAPALDDVWAGLDVASLEPDGTAVECAETSSVAEISSHVCESFFLSPERTLDCEQPVRRVFQSLGLAVDGLLDMVLDSARQLEEARQIHSRFEKEFSCKNEEMAQVVRKHQELLEQLEAESTAKARLALELHKAEGIIEGFKEEKAGLQEVLGQKEASERGLVSELEGLRQQLQRAAQRQAELREENTELCSQTEALAMDAREREAALRREVESLTQEQSEARRQADKDRAALLSQMRLLETELEEQLSHQQACARQAEELAALRQQIDSLDQHLRRQRQFMDEQAVEREREREDFQQEIQRLEEQLRQAARPRSPGLRDSHRAQLDKEVELLEEKLREKSDGLNELILKKELVDRQVLIQGEEIKRLEEMNASTTRKLLQLQEELETQRRAARAAQQDEEAFQEQQTSNLLPVSVLQSRRDEGKCLVPPEGGRPDCAEAQLEAVQGALRQREAEVLDLKEQLENLKDDLVNKNEEILHLNWKFGLQDNSTAASIKELQENARLKTFLQNKESEMLHVRESAEAQLARTGSGPLSEVVCNRSSEVEELKSIIETLRENQARLQKDNAEEIEQLHEVIEKLQRELPLGGPEAPKAGDGGAMSLQSELLGLPAEGAKTPAMLEGELHAALEAKEALSQRLAEQEHQHSQALEALQQRLQAAEEAATRQLAELGPEGLASQIREFEAALSAREAKIAERDLEIEALRQQKSTHSAELEAILAAVTRFRHTLEQQLLAATGEPPELQRLREQCVCLSRQLQALNQRFLKCQKELDEQQARGEGGSQGWVPGGEETSCNEELQQDVDGRQLAQALDSRGSDPQSLVKDDLQPAKALPTLTRARPSQQDSVISVLTVCQQQLESELLLVKKEMRLRAEDGGRVSGAVKDKGKLLEDCRLQKVDLIAQVKQLQEKLNHLVCSMSFQNIEMEDFKYQQALASPCALEDGLSDGSDNSEETDKPPPIDTFNIIWDLAEVTGNSDSLIRNEEPDAPTGEQVTSQDRSLCLQGHLHGCSQDLTHSQGSKPLKNMLRTMDLSPWSSPEVVREDSTLEPPPSVPLTPCSDALSLHSLDTSLWDGTSTHLLQADKLGRLCYPGESTARIAPKWGGSPLAVDGTPSADHQAQRVPVEKDVEDFIITSLDSQEKSRSPSVGLEGKSDGKSGGVEFAEPLSQGSGSLGAPTASPAAPPVIPRDCQQPLDAMKEKEVHPKQVKALLQMVCDESHHILALSEYRGPPRILSRSEPSAPLECLPVGGQGLLEAVPAPREHPTPGPQKGEKVQTFKASANVGLDWRGDFLQAVQEAFEKEREMLRVELWPQLCGLGPGGCSSLLERLEKVVHEQGDQQERSLEHLCLSDRSSLLSEIQALRAQLRMTHLQNQEKLQQLCTALTSVEAHGSRQEHRLRRQVELLAYKVEQEKCIASDLQKTLNEEQEKANNVRKLLVAEQHTVRDLKSELCECRQDNERLLKSLEDVQKEVLQLRSMLDGKESDLQAALQQLEGARMKERALQSQLEEERLQHVQREGQSARTLEELRASLEQQCAQSNQLCVVLKHEQTAKDNLRQELQIETSRCEALLAQERGHMAELQRSLEAERDRARDLSEALQHERVLTERLSRRPQEKPAHQALLQKLRAQEEHVHELEVALEAAQRRALEAEARVHPEEVEREQERELELQHQRDEHKIQQLQRTVQELQARVALPSAEPERLREQQRGLEKVRQQLLCAAGLLTSFINQTVDRTISDWTSSNEKAVASLLHTLETLKSELGTSSSCRKKTAAELQIQLVDVLLKDNESLSRALSTVMREKAELCKALSRLERAHRAPRTLQDGCTRKRSDKSAWKQDKMVSAGSARHPDPALDAGACSAKMEKLYLRYLRAESFRKALIYQKKYLLLLIGGFQDSEQETLSMIAHLGVFPSKADKKAVESRPFTRFRTAVRVVIAVLRLRFLVKKWQQVDGRGALAPGQALHPGEGFLVPQRQQSPPVTRESPPTRDVSSSQARDPVPKASPRRRERSSPPPNPRSERSLTASQDPEHSLTEYIHHLEMIQQRLGGVPPDSPSKKSCCQKIKQ